MIKKSCRSLLAFPQTLLINNTSKNEQATIRNRVMTFQLLLLFFVLQLIFAEANSGQWQLLRRSIGVSAMHMQLLHNDRVVIFDRTDFGQSNLSLADGKCRDDPNERALTHDCSAHSAEYDVISDTVRPLMVLTDTWCSSGSVVPNGDLIQTGGFNDGERAVRTFETCSDCDWKEDSTALLVRRWYATNCLLPDGRQIIVGGRRQFNYEFFPKTNDRNGLLLFSLPFLRITKDPEENNLYPFVHLNVDGNLFIYSNNQAILFDYVRHSVVKNIPTMPGAEPRNYPSSGSSVLLPLNPSGTEAEVLVCGGAPRGSYGDAETKIFTRALDTCGRIKITDENPVWKMETMPTSRVMGDMILLPNGDDVLIINGAAKGTAGWEYAEDPVLTPVTYRVNRPAESRFVVETATNIPRLYHSSAILLRDGRVLVGGSNPHRGYSFYGEKYPTELSLETFSPSYLSPNNSDCRPRIILSSSDTTMTHKQEFTVRFTLPSEKSCNIVGNIKVTILRPPFATHSFSMNQRMLVLEVRTIGEVGVGGTYDVQAVAPKSGVIAPSGYYMLFVSNGDLPSEGMWVHIDD